MSTAIAAEIPRLQPIERSPTLLVWLIARVFRHLLGKVIMPVRVLYTRMPKLVFPQIMMYRLVQSGLSLDPLLSHLIQTRVSVLNGCTFCSDLHRAVALREGHAESKLAACWTGPEDPAFDALQRSVLRYAEEVRLPGTCRDETWASVSEHLSERQLVEVTWLVAFTTYLNVMARALNIGSDGFCATLPRRRA